MLGTEPEHAKTIAPYVGDNQSKAGALVVDDDPTVREVLVNLLNNMGHISHEAADGVEAFNKVSNGQFDLVLLDLVMPKMNGEDTFEIIATISSSTPVIIITGYGSIESATNFMRNGAKDYLSKPINLEELRFRINRVLRESKVREESSIDLKTQLYNHRYFMKRLNEECARARRYGLVLSLALLRPTEFRRHNECPELPETDADIKRIGSLLRRHIRDCDAPCRYGDKEFGIILPDTDSDGARKMAERLLDFNETNNCSETSDVTLSKITLSIGIASCKPQGRQSTHDATALIQGAEKALFGTMKMRESKVCAIEI